ncbi:MAG: radical SAM protein [Planctomycetota bacterium]|nr:radical SAM protein [Planctomycetota bacterium]
MIDVTCLYCGVGSAAAAHRYGRKEGTGGAGGFDVPGSAAARKPVVVWNCTRSCNLRCVHCYSDSENRRYSGELATAEAEAMIADLAAFGVPVLLFSGGEPLMRPDIFHLVGKAVSSGLRATISTNGTLIGPDEAARLAELGVSYVGVSLDGIGATNDAFRGMDGAFDRALRGIRNLASRGVKAGLRLTITRRTASGISDIFDLIRREEIRRVCFYHLVPSGRGRGIEAMTPAESRAAVEAILQKTRDIVAAGREVEVLTVDSPCDGPFLLTKLRAENSPLAGRAEEALRWNGGGLNGPGTGIACISFDGSIHPDQFWHDAVLGNVRERPFSAIWSDPGIELLAGLRNLRNRIRGRCRSCRFFDLCGGGFRARAAMVTGDPWASDPGCYLADEEILDP